MVKLREKREELAKLNQFDLWSMHYATTDVIKRIKRWLEGEKPYVRYTRKIICHLYNVRLMLISL